MVARATYKCSKCNCGTPSVATRITVVSEKVCITGPFRIIVARDRCSRGRQITRHNVSVPPTFARLLHTGSSIACSIVGGEIISRAQMMFLWFFQSFPMWPDAIHSTAYGLALAASNARCVPLINPSRGLLSTVCNF